MADYNDISLLSQLATQLTVGPNDGESVSKLDDAIHQLQKFLVDYLAVAHNDDGTLKQGSVSAATFSLSGGAVPSSALVGDIPGSMIVPESIDLSRLEPATSTPGSGAVTDHVIQDRSIAGSKLRLATVTKDEIAAGAIDLANKLGANVVETDKIKDAAVTDVKIAAMSGAKLTQGTTPATIFTIAGLGAAEIGIPLVFGSGAANAKIAKLGGSIVASYDAGTNTLSITPSATGGDAVIGQFTVSTTGTNTISAWTKRTGWAKVSGGATYTLSSDTIVFKDTGVFMVLASLAMYSVEGAQIRLTLNGAVVGSSNVQWIPVGTCDSVQVVAMVTVEAVDDVMELQYYSTRTQATNGLGYAAAGLATQYGEIRIIRIV